MTAVNNTHALSRRRALCAITLCSLPIPRAAAWDLSLPSLENLRPKFELLSLGVSPEAAIAALGAPATRSETYTLGVSNLVLTWKDITGYTYTARFLAGKMYSRDFGNRS